MTTEDISKYGVAQMQETTYVKAKLMLQLALKASGVERFWGWVFIFAVQVIPLPLFLAIESQRPGRSVAGAIFASLVILLMPCGLLCGLWRHCMKHNALSLVVAGETLVVLQRGRILITHPLSDCRWSFVDQSHPKYCLRQGELELRPQIALQCPFSLWGKDSCAEYYCAYTPEKAEAWKRILSTTPPNPSKEERCPQAGCAEVDKRKE